MVTSTMASFALEDPLDGALVVSLDQLPLWSLDEELLDTPPDPDAAFHLDHRLNRKVSVWRGAGWRLAVDCLVVGNSESLVDRTGATGEAFARGGDEIARDCALAERCRTGDVAVTRAGALPCKRVVHAVGPRFVEKVRRERACSPTVPPLSRALSSLRNGRSLCDASARGCDVTRALLSVRGTKYATAAESALHSCYRRALAAAKEAGLRTVALSVVAARAREYPREAACHVALRTTRRFLERCPDAFDRIVWCAARASSTPRASRVLDAACARARTLRIGGYRAPPSLSCSSGASTPARPTTGRRTRACCPRTSRARRARSARPRACSRATTATSGARR